MNAKEKIDAFYEAREAYEQAHKLSGEMFAAMKDAERAAVDKMLEEGLKSMGRDDGTHVSLRKQYTCSVTLDNEDQVRQWLVDTNGDDAQFVVEKVHKPALLEWMREKAMEVGDVPDFLKLNTTPALSVRGWKTRG